MERYTVIALNEYERAKVCACIPVTGYFRTVEGDLWNVAILPIDGPSENEAIRDAVQEQSAGTMDVRTASGTGEAVGERDAEYQASSG